MERRNLLAGISAGIAGIETIPDDISITELAEDVVRGKRKLSQTQLRMLIEILPYYAPKLSAMQVGWREGQDMASKMYALERRNARFEKIKLKLIAGECVNTEPQVIEHEPQAE